MFLGKDVLKTVPLSALEAEAGGGEDKVGMRGGVGKTFAAVIYRGSPPPAGLVSLRVFPPSGTR